MGTTLAGTLQEPMIATEDTLVADSAQGSVTVAGPATLEIVGSFQGNVHVCDGAHRLVLPGGSLMGNLMVSRGGRVTTSSGSTLAGNIFNDGTFSIGGTCGGNVHNRDGHIDYLAGAPASDKDRSPWRDA